MSAASPGAPDGDVYEWFRRATELVDSGDANAALVLIERVLEDEPESTAVLELRARALFDARHLDEALAAFLQLTEISPDDDYAHYGLGMTFWRLQLFGQAEDQMAIASVMRPEQIKYRHALQQVRATLKARAEADLPLDGPINAPSAPPPRSSD